MYMKFRKTKTAARSVYIYRFADGTVAVLHPGEQGVSTEIIDFCTSWMTVRCIVI